MDVKRLTVGLGLAVAIATPGAAVADPQIQAPLTVFHAPHPQAPAPAPAPALPSAEQLTGILDNLTDPHVADEVKSGLVAGGLQRHQTDVLDHQLRRLGRHHGLPLSFTATNIAATGPDTVSADITANGPQLAAPITKPVSFTDANGWMLSQNGADELLEEVVGRLPN